MLHNASKYVFILTITNDNEKKKNWDEKGTIKFKNEEKLHFHLNFTLLMEKILEIMPGF